MQCPKCGADQPDRQAVCGRCGIVFEKYYKYHPRPGDPVPPPVAQTLARPANGTVESTAEPTDDFGSRLAALLLPDTQGGDWLGLGGRAVVWLLLLVWGLYLMLSSIASNAVGDSFLHLINLPFHEFGHILFRPFGQWVTSLGGTLAQLLMPAICGGVLLIQTRDPFGASACLWWLGENFLDIAPYIDDARAGQLPLLGGNFGDSSPYGFHDWQYLLGETGLSHLDHAIARGSYVLGSLIMLAALGWGAWLLVRHYGQLSEQG